MTLVFLLLAVILHIGGSEGTKTIASIEGVPDTLQNCTLANRTKTSLILECVQGYDGGYPQFFVMEVYESGQNRNIAVVTTNVTLFFVQGLPEESTFVLVIYAANIKGRSRSIILKTTTGAGLSFVEPLAQEISSGPVCKRDEEPLEDGGRSPDLVKGAEYMLSKRNPSTYGWGRDTHRAFIALALSGALHDPQSLDQKLMVKELQLQLAVALAKQHTEHLTAGQLALYVQGLLSACLDPRNFFGINLVSSLRHRPANASQYEFALVSLALCNSDSKLDKNRFLKLIEILGDQEDQKHKISDTQSMTMLALSCGLKENPIQPLERYLNRAVKQIKKSQRPDGSFGNIYTSALAWQALLGADADDLGWNRTLAEDFILSQQKSDGSFSDFMGTYFCLPPLANKTLLSLTHWTCQVNPEISDSKDLAHQDINTTDITLIDFTVSIRAQDIQDYKRDLKTQSGNNLYDGLLSNQQFISIEWKDTSYGHMIVGVDGLNQDPAHKKYWMIYIVGKDGNETLATTGVDQIYPKNGDHFLFQLSSF